MTLDNELWELTFWACARQVHDLTKCTHFSDEEANVGFWWRKLASSTSVNHVVESHVEELTA